MARGKKNGNQDKPVKVIILVTAILNLIRSIVDLVETLLE